MRIFLMFVFIGLYFQVYSVDRKAYYDVLASSDETRISAFIKELKSQDESPLIEAYIAALECKKADLLLNPKEKLDSFKKGATSLDAIIEKYPNNAEYRYLRLTIQENAPSIMHYDENLVEDKKIILSKFSQFDAEMKVIIKDYAKTSKILKVEELE